MVAAALGALIDAGCVIYTSDGPPAPGAPHRPRPRAHRHAAPRPNRPLPPNAKATAAPAPSVVVQPTHDLPPASNARPVSLSPGAAEGRPEGFKPAAPAAYWIWQGPRGSWRVRTTTKNMLHLFRGRVVGESGALVDVQPSRNQLESQIHKTDDGYAFAFKTSAHADGFNFTTRDGGCVRFDLQLDGGPHPKRIFVGKAQHQPAGSHFVVCPAGAATVPPGARN
jgi:hypothetical protein